MSQYLIVTAVQDAAAEGPSGGAGEEGGEEGRGQPGGKGKNTYIPQSCNLKHIRNSPIPSELIGIAYHKVTACFVSGHTAC